MSKKMQSTTHGRSASSSSDDIPLARRKRPRRVPSDSSSGEDRTDFDEALFGPSVKEGAMDSTSQKKPNSSSSDPKKPVPDMVRDGKFMRKNSALISPRSARKTGTASLSTQRKNSQRTDGTSRLEPSKATTKGSFTNSLIRPVVKTGALDTPSHGSPYVTINSNPPSACTTPSKTLASQNGPTPSAPAPNAIPATTPATPIAPIAIMVPPAQPKFVTEPEVQTITAQSPKKQIMLSGPDSTKECARDASEGARMESVMEANSEIHTAMANAKALSKEATKKAESHVGIPPTAAAPKVVIENESNKYIYDDVIARFKGPTEIHAIDELLTRNIEVEKRVMEAGEKVAGLEKTSKELAGALKETDAVQAANENKILEMRKRFGEETKDLEARLERMMKDRIAESEKKMHEKMEKELHEKTSAMKAETEAISKRATMAKQKAGQLERELDDMRSATAQEIQGLQDKVSTQAEEPVILRKHIADNKAIAEQAVEIADQAVEKIKDDIRMAATNRFFNRTARQIKVEEGYEDRFEKLSAEIKGHSSKGSMAPSGADEDVKVISSTATANGGKKRRKELADKKAKTKSKEMKPEPEVIWIED